MSSAADSRINRMMGCKKYRRVSTRLGSRKLKVSRVVKTVMVRAMKKAMARVWIIDLGWLGGASREG